MDFGSTITAATTNGPGGSVDVALSGGLSLAGSSFISTTTSGVGMAGAVAIKAQSVSIEDPSSFSFIGSLALPGSTGTGGSTTVNASTVRITGMGRLSSFAGGAGDAGPIAVAADSIEMSGDGAQMVSESTGPGRGGAIFRSLFR